MSTIPARGDAPRCATRTAAGAPCRAYATSSSTFCLSHDPAMREQLTAARRLGGRRRRRDAAPVSGAPTPLRSIEDALALLELAAGDAKRLDVGVNRVRVLVEIARTSAQIIDQHDTAERLATLEAHVAALTSGRRATGRGGGRRVTDPPFSLAS